MTIIVTGAAGFIGANNVKALNEQGERDIVAVDHLAQADKFHNLVDCDVADYLDKQEFRITIDVERPFVGSVFYENRPTSVDGRR